MTNGSKNSLFYLTIISAFSGLIYLLSMWGRQLEDTAVNTPTASPLSHWQEFVKAFLHNLEHPSALLLAQMVVIIFVARVIGWFFNKVGQPTVIGEIVAGIALGPSLFGMYFPEFSAVLFTPNSLDNLKTLSHVGLVLFMFIIGMELDLKILRTKAQDAIIISHTSIAFSFLLGMTLAVFLFEEFAPEGGHFLFFGLFMGVAMSITAFPVLARIMQERNIHKTKLGSIVLTCAASDDITAWLLLAAIIAIVKAGSVVSAFYNIVLAGIYVATMIGVVRPFIKRLGDLHTSRENLSKPIVAIFFIVLLVSAYASEAIGIHALFGAFMAGAIMPENTKFRNIFIEKIEDVSLVLLLPLFFVYTGLRTQIGLLNEPHHWYVAGLIILVAVTGKFVGGTLTSRFVGLSWKDSFTVGALMNTRGLMELVVLNIGYDLGVLSPEMFAMMVVMALVTTMMTGPALSLIQYLSGPVEPENPISEVVGKPMYKILLSFAKPETGRTLLKIASGLTRLQIHNSKITAMHLTPVKDVNFNEVQFEKESFEPIMEEAERIGQEVTTLFRTAHDIENEIAVEANKGHFNLLLIGVGQSIFEGSVLGRVLDFTTKIIDPNKLLNTVKGKEKPFISSVFDERTSMILEKSKVPVGIYVDKQLEYVRRVIVPVFSGIDDLFLAEYARKFASNIGAQVLVMPTSEEPGLANNMLKRIGNPATVAHVDEAMQEIDPHHDLMLMSLMARTRLLEDKQAWLTDVPSVLVISQKEA